MPVVNFIFKVLFEIGLRVLNIFKALLAIAITILITLFVIGLFIKFSETS